VWGSEEWARAVRRVLAAVAVLAAGVLLNGPSGDDAGTTVPFTFAFTVPCGMTADPSIGSKCSRNIG
jgi:hypothetical protein